ncbi:nicotinate-nucleotide--dimethylbenzimidazole phosphoribosyltransferase [Brucella abortus]|nr:nicotinate-nucleotide--dimethylbenzimidazole phosphoribosyltransferase [Brucella abortus]
MKWGSATTDHCGSDCACAFGGTAEDWVGPGTGSAGESDGERSLPPFVGQFAPHQPHLQDPLEVLSRCLGRAREIAGHGRRNLAARMEKIPVIVDGFVASARCRALCGTTRKPSIIACSAMSRRRAGGIASFWQRWSKEPLLDLGMRLGGRLPARPAAANIVKAAALCHSGMATFESGHGVSASE